MKSLTVRAAVLSMLAAGTLAAGTLAAGVPSASALTATSWSTVTRLSIAGQSVRPQAISATDKDVWVAGYTYNGLEFRALALRRHNGTWSRVSTPDVETEPAKDFLYGVRAVSPTDVWMAGQSATSISNSVSRPLIEHWDGSKVSIVPAPDLGPGSAGLTAIDGTANNLWAVGTFTDASFVLRGLVLHYDGTRWQQVDFKVAVPECGDSGSAQLTSVTVLGPGDVYVGGACGQAGLLQHLDGGWVSSGYIAAIGEIDGLTNAGDGTVWAAGWQQVRDSTSTGSRGIALHGKGQSFVQVPSPVGNGNVFTAISANRNQVIAVGNGPSKQPPFAGFGAFSLSGTTWTPETVRTQFNGFGSFTGVTRDSAGRVLAVGFGLNNSGENVGIVSRRS